MVYAYLTSNLSITGSTQIAANSWNIYFANLVVNTNSVEATNSASIDQDDTTSISYAVTLNRPGDFYEFNVDMVNSGSLTGLINLVTIDGVRPVVTLKKNTIITGGTGSKTDSWVVKD